MPQKSDQSSTSHSSSEVKPPVLHPPTAPSILDLLRQRKRRRLRKRVRNALHVIMCTLLPLLMLVLGIIFCFVGGFHHLRLFLSIGCVLIICFIGLVLQSCFWSRSQPNKFTRNEVLRVATINDSFETLKANAANGVKDQSEDDVGESEEEISHEYSKRPSRPSAELLEVRQLSIAMTRAASELRHAARQRAVTMGASTFARSFTLGGGQPTNIAPTDYERSAINWYGNFTASELTHMRRLSQWQNFV
ncbi:hypothetical protein Aperf_G00000096695 [Anoplocephala perfoliata]